MRGDESDRRPAIAYFSMEMALDPEIPTYSGGLGVLAGDTLRAAADLGLPMVGMSLVHRKGYFRQHLDESGQQRESPDEWSPEDRLEPMPSRVSVEIEGRRIGIRAWRYVIESGNGHRVPVYLLDTAIPENREEDRSLTDQLYGGDDRYRLSQEAVLGLGGIATLEALGYEGRAIYHMNEGHSALLTLALLEDRLRETGDTGVTDEDIEAIRRRCVFTTHTPVPAGHDQFPIDLVRDLLGNERAERLRAAGCLMNGTLNLTYVALRFSRYINGVSMRHGEISTGMFPGYPVTAITNGIHVPTWVSPPFRELYDNWVRGWREDSLYLRYAIRIPPHEITDAHARAKRELIELVEARAGVRLRPDVFTIGFARRATPYKRADLLLSDPARLKAIARQVGPLQILYAGKAHPRDEAGKAMIRRIFDAARGLQGIVPIVYLENYGMALGRSLCSGVDLWLNTPRKPQEASGTSGMKAALNGVPSLSVLDGWWIEGHSEGVTGWSIPHGPCPPDDDSCEISAMYEKLERVILPLFYGQPPAYAEVMRCAIALNASFFNTQRMLSQYIHNAYFPPGRRAVGEPGRSRATG